MPGRGLNFKAFNRLIFFRLAKKHFDYIFCLGRIWRLGRPVRSLVFHGGNERIFDSELHALLAAKKQPVLARLTEKIDKEDAQAVDQEDEVVNEEAHFSTESQEVLARYKLAVARQSTADKVTAAAASLEKDLKAETAVIIVGRRLSWNKAYGSNLDRCSSHIRKIDIKYTSYVYNTVA